MVFDDLEDPAHRVGSDDRNAFLLQSIDDLAIYILDPRGHVLSWNLGAELIKGSQADEIIGTHFSVFYTGEDRAADVPQRNLEAARKNGRCETQGWRVKAGGERMWASIVIHAIHHAGMLVGFAKVTRDCSDQKRHAEAMEMMASNMALALSFLPCGACLLDRRGTVVLSNPALLALFPEASADASLGKAIRMRGSVSLDGCSDLDGLPWLGFDADMSSCEIEAGNLILSVRAKAAQDQGWVVTFEDVTARRHAEHETARRARHDVLTGLANRDGLEERLRQGLASCVMTGGCAVLYLDLDRFKAVNDTCGHQAGDTVLKEAARRILGALCPGDFACRIGGDEFMVVPAWPITAEGAMRTARRLKEQFDCPFVVDARQVYIGTSIGVAVSLPGEASQKDLTGNADLALYKAKHEGRGCIRLFDNELGLAMLKRRAMESSLSRALAANEFSLVYQPICSEGGQAVCGFEALLRWHRADGMQISPSEFIPLAEELGAMAKIGGWVLETACTEAARWPSHLTIAVNISATQIHDPKLVDRVEAALRKACLEPSRLEIELTETAMITDHACTLRVLTQLRALGVGLAIDDFGTGFSSLSFLRTLPFTRLKIDRSFVSDLVNNPNSMAIVRGVMRMGHDLGLAVTAEGVETEAQRTVLAGEACRDMQGYLFAPPMLREEVLPFLASGAFDRVAVRSEPHHTLIPARATRARA